MKVLFLQAKTSRIQFPTGHLEVTITVHKRRETCFWLMSPISNRGF